MGSDEREARIQAERRRVEVMEAKLATMADAPPARRELVERALAAARAALAEVER